MRNYWRDAVEKGNDPNMFMWMNNPEGVGALRVNPPLPVLPPSPTPTPTIIGSFPVTSGVSYPLFLDPIGDNAQTSTAKYWVTGGTRLGLPRRNIDTFNGNQGITFSITQRLRFCTLLDDLTYDQTGTGAPTALVPVERGGRYNWLAIVQRPENTAPNLANMTILVFDGRAPGYAIPNGELVCPVTIVPVPGAKVSSLTLTYSSLVPPVRPPVSKGRWIALHTLLSATAANPTQTNILQFYRVVSANDETPGQLDIELQTPIRDDQVLFNANTSAIVFTGLSEVFERPQLNGK